MYKRQGEIYAAGLDRTNRIELTVVEVEPDGGPQAAYFPALDDEEWRRELIEAVPASNGVPAHRYERLSRITPVLV